ncbi:hypothetical protein [Peribacillus frigoritolerans]|nr:hypothetical protein [Peribacillus frigoritolerans]MCY9006754.1 hypothetical protein [Peribacillus frigoritolerans]
MLRKRVRGYYFFVWNEKNYESNELDQSKWIGRIFQNEWRVFLQNG